jgi:hypothetical protein
MVGARVVGPGGGRHLGDGVQALAVALVGLLALSLCPLGWALAVALDPFIMPDDTMSINHLIGEYVYAERDYCSRGSGSYSS